MQQGESIYFFSGILVGTENRVSAFTFFSHIDHFGTFFCGFAAKKPGFPGVPPFAFASQTAPGRFAPLQSLVPHGLFALLAT
jgi:hypothetical protein